MEVKKMKPEIETITLIENAKITYTKYPDYGMGERENFQIDRINPKKSMGIKAGEIIYIAGAGKYRVCNLSPIYQNIDTLEKIK
jgi:hypothetical protein